MLQIPRVKAQNRSLHSRTRPYPTYSIYPSPIFTPVSLSCLGLLWCLLILFLFRQRALSSERWAASPLIPMKQMMFSWNTDIGVSHISIPSKGKLSYIYIYIYILHTFFGIVYINQTIGRSFASLALGLCTYGTYGAPLRGRSWFTTPRSMVRYGTVGLLWGCGKLISIG